MCPSLPKLLVAAFVFAGCAVQHDFQSPVPPPPPPQPLLQGASRNVSSADIDRILLITRRYMVKEYGSALPIYFIDVADSNHVTVGYWVRGQYLRKDVERVGAKWRVTGAEPERIITTGANIPTS